MPTVTLPSGCTGLDMQDGTRYNAPKQDTSIEVTDRHAAAIRRGWYGQNNVIGSTGYMLGTKTGRRCEPCRRTWNAWNGECPRCGLPTIPEEGP